MAASPKTTYNILIIAYGEVPSQDESIMFLITAVDAVIAMNGRLYERTQRLSKEPNKNLTQQVRTGYEKLQKP